MSRATDALLAEIEHMSDPDRLMTPREVAAVFRVDPKTVARWAAADRIRYIRTPGGHARFRAGDVWALLEGDTR